MKVEYVDHMGSDLTVVNAARTSLGKHKTVLDESDERLLNYLAAHRPAHWTPFSHPQLTVRIQAPIFVARQLYRHQVGLAVNEISRRYVDAPPRFFRPDEWRKRPENGIKQGSGGPLEPMEQSNASELYDNLLREIEAAYAALLGLNVAPEQARMLLPQSMYTEWYWTGSLYAFFRVVDHRLRGDAQRESQAIAVQLHALLLDYFPHAYGALYRHAREYDPS